MDKNGSGTIGYDEFTLLSEERWRNFDAYAQYQAGVASHDAYVSTPSAPALSLKFGDSDASKLGILSNDAEGY